MIEHYSMKHQPFSTTLLALHALCLLLSPVADGLPWNSPALSFINFDLGSCDIPGSFGLYGAFYKFSRYAKSGGGCKGVFKQVYFPPHGSNLMPRNMKLKSFDASPGCDDSAKSCQVDWKYQKMLYDYHVGTLKPAKILCNNGSILAVLGRNDVWKWGSFADRNKIPNSSKKEYMLVYSTGTNMSDINENSLWPTLSNELPKEDGPKYCIDLFSLMTKLQKELAKSGGADADLANFFEKSDADVDSGKQCAKIKNTCDEDRDCCGNKQDPTQSTAACGPARKVCFRCQGQGKFCKKNRQCCSGKCNRDVSQCV